MDKVAIVTIDNPPVSVASASVRHGLKAAHTATEADADVRTVVLICAGRTFNAGAEVKEFTLSPQDPILPDLLSAIEAAGKSWIARGLPARRPNGPHGRAGPRGRRGRRRAHKASSPAASNAV